MRGARGERWASIPAFSRTVAGGYAHCPLRGGCRWGAAPGRPPNARRDEIEIGMITRQCTTEYKLVPIRRHVRVIAGLERVRSTSHPVVEQWIGISTDEAIRMKPSFQSWQVNRWPLIEQRMSRSDCLAWLRQHGYPIPPKSACLGCPFHSNARWRQIRDEDPAGWADAVDADRRIRTGFRGMRAELFLHRSCVPLDQADLSDDSAQLDLWPLNASMRCLRSPRDPFPQSAIDLNLLLVEWGHRMGPVRRPNHGWSHGLFHAGEPVAVVATDRLIRERVAGFERSEAIELSRLATARPDLSRVVLRLWRAFVFPAICAEGGYEWAVSYQDAVLHTGNLYRFDGWVTIGRSRSGIDSRTARRGRNKVIWGWCDDAERRSARTRS